MAQSLDGAPTPRRPVCKYIDPRPRLRPGLFDRRLLAVVLEPQGNFAHEAGVVAIGEPSRLAGDGAEHVGQGLHFRLCVIAEDMRRHEVLPPGPGVSDADTN